MSLTVAKGRTNNTFSVQHRAHEQHDDERILERDRRRPARPGSRIPRAQDPLNWGVPNLTFSNFSVRSERGEACAPTRASRRATRSRARSRRIRCASAPTSGTTRRSSQSNGNARGTFTFTGPVHGQRRPIAAGTRAPTSRTSCSGMPQQATLQVGGLTRAARASRSTSTSKTTGSGARA